MSARCPACHEESPEGARFCHACGAPLSSLPDDRLQSLRAFIPTDIAQRILAAGGLGERRVVTAVFCDVVGSTALGERLGPERFKVIMDQLLGQIVAAVARYEGTVAQVMGDGLLAFFGAPLAHEDDPERAMRAALDIRDAVGAYARDLEAAYGVSLQVRVGANTGPVVLSRIADVLQIAYNALGDTVTTAARLQSVAEPGAILAAEATARLVAPLFEFRPIGPLALKGKAAPVPAVEVLQARPVTGKVRGIAGLASALVGRNHELVVLNDSIRALTEGRGQIVALIGEAGIGKSRLIAEAQRLTPHVHWLEGRCLSYAGAIPYFPFLDLLREWLGVTPADPEAKLRIELRAAVNRVFGQRAGEVYPYLATMLRLPLEREPGARLADLSAESLQHQTFKLVYEWAVRLSADRPLALIFDDLHWADATSLALVEALLDVTEEAHVLLALLFRAEREHGSWRINDLARQRFPHRHTEIVLQPLTAEYADQLLSNLLASPDFPREIRDLILQKAEGNPFFVEEVLRDLIDAGELVRERERWRTIRPLTAWDIPDSIQGVLLSRIDRLPAQVRRVLQAASVMGRLFPLEILKTVVAEDGKVETALADLQRLDLIVERRRIPAAEYRFKHALTQEVAYSTLLEGERRHLHREVGRALETKYADRLEEVYGLLAYHYDESAEEERALHFLVRAGDKARAEYADKEALRHYSRAVELLKRRGEAEAAAKTLMKMALAYHIAFDFRAANEAYREAFGIMDRLPSTASVLEPAATLRWATLEPETIDRVKGLTPFSALVLEQVFEGLLRNAPELNVVPALARSWEISSDGTRYVFHLRRRRWSDGRPVTAHDFVFSWLRGMRGTDATLFHDVAGAKRYHEGLAEDPASVGIRAMDDHTLEVVLDGPRAYFPFILAHPATHPAPRWTIEQFGEEWTSPAHFVGNGPFVITDWQRGSHARLTVNPQYDGPRLGNVKEIRFIFANLDDPTPFKDGAADVQYLATIAEADAALLRDTLHSTPPHRVIYIFFRCDRPPFSDRRLRLAFAHATNRPALVAPGRQHALAADGGFVPPPIPGHSPQIGVPYDPEEARRLLAAARAGRERDLDALSLLVPPIGTRGEREIYDALISSWKAALGVDVTLVPTHNYLRTLREDPPALGRFGWLADHPDPDNFLRVNFHSTSSNPTRWKNAQFDALVEAAQASTDHRKRMALYHEADSLLVAKEAAIIPLAYTRPLTLVQRYVQGWWSTFLGQSRAADLIVAAEEVEP